MSAFALPLVELCGGGQQGWSNYGIIMGAAVCLCYWAVAWTARTYDTPQLAQIEAVEASKEEGVSHKKKETFGDIVRSTIDTFKNRELLLLSGIFFASLASTGLSGAINMYYFTYVLGHQEWIVATTAFGVVTALLGPVLTPIVTNLWGKRRSMMIFAAAAIVPNLLVVFIPNPSVTILTLFISIANLFNGVVGTLMWAMIPDVVDWGEYNTGVRANGLAQAAVQLMNQFGQALGQALPVAVIGALGYVANQAGPSLRFAGLPPACSCCSLSCSQRCTVLRMSARSPSARSSAIATRRLRPSSRAPVSMNSASDVRDHKEVAL